MVKDEFLKLKQRIENELIRRNSSTNNPYSNPATNGNMVMAEHYEKIGKDLRQIDSGKDYSDNVRGLEIRRTDINYLNADIKSAEEFPREPGVTDCSNECMGVCSTSCLDSCEGSCIVHCNSNCDTTCEGACKGTCWSCYGSCDGKCDDAQTCSNGSSGGSTGCDSCANGCGGCGGCGNKCTGTCFSTSGKNDRLNVYGIINKIRRRMK